MLVTCPRCDGQGNLYTARVEQLGIELQICDECEATWLPGMEVSKRNFLNLTAYLSEHGLNLGEAKITIIEPTPHMQWWREILERKRKR